MPTDKQKRVAKRVLENNGIAISQAMKGIYAEPTTKNPQQLTESKGWKELMEQYLPDEKLAKKHNQLLSDKNHNIQLNALGLAYKVKGYEKSDSPPATQFNFFNLSLDEIRHRREQIIARGQAGTSTVGNGRGLSTGQD